jgi:cytochrome c oxidase subunit IV
MVEPKKRIWGWGYFLFLAVMAYIGAGMIIYFGRMKWLLDFGFRILKCGLIMTSERLYVYRK